ncbi:MAG: YdcF family protein [Micrococcaceae bacterium]|nr:YdcF family protein [Micrococcaceae bacterium]
MEILTVITAVLGMIGAIAAVIGIKQIVQDPRRIAAYAYTVGGIGAALMSAGLILHLILDEPLLLVIMFVTAVLVLLSGNLLGYPLLVGFLLWAGITNLRRESRSLANMLSLLAGIGLLLLPTTLSFFDTSEPRNDLAYQLQYGIHLGLVLLVTYVAFCFAAFTVASIAYRLRKNRRGSAAVIVLGAGLLNGNVPPLLAGRLKRGVTAQRKDIGDPILITSGGKGDDEPRSEGAAMREYVIEQGVDPERVIAEEQSTTTEENLRFSQRLMSDPKAPVTVVTSSYHVFRAALLTRALGLRAHVVGASTVWYYLPGAFIREFIAVMRDHIRLHMLAVVGIIVLTIAFTSWITPLAVPPEGAF